MALETVGFFPAKDYFNVNSEILADLEPSAALEGRIEAIAETEAEVTGQFQMENELAGFVDVNWDSIFGSKLEKIGREFRAGNIGEIDFLARDKKDGRFVVLELKREKTGDCAVGQILRYMSWIAHSKASGDHCRVRGIIICQEQDEQLKFAVSPIADRVKVLEYNVRFDLGDADVI